MLRINLVLACILIPLSLSAGLPASDESNTPHPKKDYLITISTSLGDMNVVLHDKTPLHKSNFIKLARERFYDGLLFHRVIENFMIQGGDPKSRGAAPETLLGNGDIGYTIPAEFDSTLFHRRGALAAARNNNPKKESSGCQFYLVQGKVYSEKDLNKQVAKAFRKPNIFQREVYMKEGGTPHLDGSYTVFGQVIKGLEVIDKISAQPVGGRDRPETDITIKSVRVKLVRKKKIERKYKYSYH